MNVSVDSSFEKDTNRIDNKKLLLRIAGCIEQARKADSLAELKNLKKLKGFPYHYRIRIGEYRAGVIIRGTDIKFVRFLNRKVIYRYFP